MQITTRLAVSVGGNWSAAEAWPVLAVHANLLPNGKVMAWDATPDDFDEDPHTARWYSSVAALPNGEMLTLGGSYSPNPLAEVFQLDQRWRALPLQPPYSLKW